MFQFINHQVKQVQQSGAKVLMKKIIFLVRKLFKLQFYVLVIMAVMLIRLIKPLILVRIGELRSSRIGHFAANTELYLCERDAGINVPSQRHIDIFYQSDEPICNRQLAAMWKRVLFIWPAWILDPVSRFNKLFPGGEVHEIGKNSQHDRDVHNLLDSVPIHLKFTDEEETLGLAGLRAMGIPIGGVFVCLAVRDGAYLAKQFPKAKYNYHSYRDCDIDNYVAAAEALTDHGYYVIRMGAVANAPMNSSCPKVIDYAVNGMRSDFMDIFLGARCAFFVSSGLGWDAVPAWLFRKPGVFVNLVPLGYLPTFSNKFIVTTRRHYRDGDRKELSLSEIFSLSVGLSMTTLDFESKGVYLIENTSEEIREVVIEMAERLNGNWHAHPDDESLQRLFWQIFPTEVVDAYAGRKLHGEIRSRFGANFLRNNREWLQ